MPRTAIAFHGSSSNATDIGKIVLITGPTLGMIFSIPARSAFAITSFIPRIDSPIPASKATHIELISTLYDLSDLTLLMNDIESSEEYLKKALNIQYNNFLKKQTSYIPTYNKIKNIYYALNDSNKINELDSLLNILNIINADSIIHNVDSLINYPSIIHFQKTTIDSTDLVSQYSNNDKAIDFINNGLMYLEAKIYTEAIKNFDQGLKIEASIVD